MWRSWYTEYTLYCVCVFFFYDKCGSICKHLLFQYFLLFGWREGLKLKAGLVNEYYRQIEVRVPHLNRT